MSISSVIQEAYKLTADSTIQDQQHYEKNIEALLKNQKGKDFLIPLNFYLTVLENTQSALFPYLSDTQKNQTLRDLQVTYLLLATQLKYEIDHQKKENCEHYLKQLKQCEELIDALNYSQWCKQQGIQPSPEKGYLSDEKPVAYLGLIAGRLFADQMVEITSGSKTKIITDKMGLVNEKRLYGVWASTLLKTMLSLLPPDFFNGDQAKVAITYPDLYTGTMSWALYYFRFSLNLGLLLKHTIAGPWMSQVEKEEGWVNRFWTQWEQRKFALLNDSFWATANLLCFFWLYGKGATGTWGDALTLALLVFDIALTVWDCEEQRTKYNKEINDYEEAIKELKRQTIELKVHNKKLQDEINNLNKILAEAYEQEKIQQIKDKLAQLQAQKEEQEKQVIELEVQTSALDRAKVKCEREWNYKKMTLATNITYALALMVAFALLTGPFFPIAAATAAAMTIAGAVLCFAFSVLCNAIKGGIEVHKSKMTLKEVRAEQEERINAFIALANLPEVDENAKKLLFLEIKKLKIDSEYQEKMITLQTMRLMRIILIESMIPPIVFVTLVFLPLGVSTIGILAATIAFAALAHFIIERAFKAETKELKFDENEYKEFCVDPEHWDKKSNNSLAFFKSQEEKDHSILTNKKESDCDFSLLNQEKSANP